MQTAYANKKTLLLLTISLALLASCGYKDDLYLPDNQNTTSNVKPVNQTESNIDGDTQ